MGALKAGGRLGRSGLYWIVLVDLGLYWGLVFIGTLSTLGVSANTDSCMGIF